ncbi:MAG: hypothetical protein RR478_00860 [Bacilli bacterium]
MDKVKVSIKNEDGKTIEKEIDMSLLPIYLNIGWEKVENKVNNFKTNYESEDNIVGNK